MTILVEVRLAGMHHIPNRTAWLASPPFATLNLASVRRLIRDGFLRPSADDEDLFEVSPSGQEALHSRPDLLAVDGRTEAFHQPASFGSKTRRAQLRSQDTREERAKILMDLAAQLGRQGAVMVDGAALTVPLHTWRKLAREAGKTLGRPIETVAGRYQVAAVLTDWPATPAEAEISHAPLRAAVEGRGVTS